MLANENLRVEFHAHTIFSKDSLTRPQKLIETCDKKHIDRIVITDHNTIAGALRAKEIDPELIIVGEEIMTTEGELLAAFVEEEIPPGLPPMEAINLLRSQEAFISVSHPFDRMRAGHWSLNALINISPHVDAIEIFNARCMLPKYNRFAKNFATKYNLRGTVGSDAHAEFEIGKATMLLPVFNDSQGLRRSLDDVSFQMSLSAPWVHLTSRYAVWRKKRAKDRYQ